MRLALLLALLASLFASRVAAQTCTGGEFESPPIVANSTVNYGNGPGVSIYDSHIGARQGLTLSFYAKPAGTAPAIIYVGDEDQYDTYGPREPTLQIRASAGSWSVMYYDKDLDMEVFECHSDTDDTPDTCPAANTGTWYHFEVDCQMLDGGCDVKVAPCGSTPQLFATAAPRDLGYPQGNEVPDRTGFSFSEIWVENLSQPSDFEIAEVTWERYLIGPNCDYGPGSCDSPRGCSIYTDGRYYTECPTWDFCEGHVYDTGAVGAGGAGGGPWTPDTVADFYASRTSCVWPCPVQFEAQSVEGLTWAQVRDSDFEWDFDDDGTADAHGFIAYHVFEAAGTYDVKMRRDNGDVWNLKTITVTDPDRTVCVHDGTDPGCPNGGTSYTDLASAISAVQSNEDAHFYLERGLSFGVDEIPWGRDPQMTLLGAYGSGAAPVINWDEDIAGQGCEQKAYWDAFVFQDLDFTWDGMYTAPSNHALWRRIKITGDLDCSEPLEPASIFSFDEGDSLAFLVDLDVKVTDASDNGALLYSGSADRLVLDGGAIFYDSAGTGHVFRVNGGSYHLFRNAAWRDSGAYSWNLRGNEDGTQKNLAWALVQGNAFGPIGFAYYVGPQYSGANEWVEKIVFDGNLFTDGSVNLNAIAGGQNPSVAEVLLRDNVIVGNGSIVQIQDDAGGLGEIVFDGNTAYDATASSIGDCAGASNCILRNNVAEGATLSDCYDVSGAGASTVSSNWCFAAGFVYCVDPQDESQIEGAGNCYDPSFGSTTTPTCVGGTRATEPCLRDSNCPGGSCTVPADFMDPGSTRGDGQGDPVASIYDFHLNERGPSKDVGAVESGIATLGPEPTLAETAAEETDPSRWWEAFGRWLVAFMAGEEPEPEPEPEVKPAIDRGDPVTGAAAYQTARMVALPSGGGFCSGIVIGPHSAATASHCISTISAQEPGAPWHYGADSGTYAVEIEHEGKVTAYPAYRIVGYEIAEGYTYEQPLPDGHDLAFVYTIDPMPPPYATLYDHTTDAAGCNYVEAHGYSAAGTGLSKCEYGIRYRRGLLVPPNDGRNWLGSYGQPFGMCEDPFQAYQRGGDSGGPVYAVGDWGSGVEARYIGPQSGGGHWNHYNYFRQTAAEGGYDYSTWFDTWHDPSAVGPAFTSSDGVEFHKAIVDRFDGDILAGDVPIQCSITATASGSPIRYVGCEFVTPDLPGASLSCFDEDPVGDLYECSVTLPQGTSNKWTIGSFLTAVEGGPVVRSDRQNVRRTTGLIGNGFTLTGSFPTYQFPVVSNVHPPSYPAPGGDAICKLSAQPDSNLDLERHGCTLTSASYPRDIICIGREDEDDFQSGAYCRVTLPSDVPPGSTWSVSSAFAQDATFGIAGGNWLGDEAFTVFDCASNVPDFSHTGPGWSVSQSETNASGRAPIYEAWIRPSVNDVEAVFAMGETAISDLAGAELGLKLEADGSIAYLSGGQWVDTAETYVGGQWIKVRFRGNDITKPVSQDAASYDVEVAACGKPSTVLALTVPTTTGPRLYRGMEHWAVYSAGATQTVDVLHVDWTPHGADATQCAWEGWDCGTNIPDGMGGTIPSCGVGAGACPIPGDSCGADPALPYNCSPPKYPTTEISGVTDYWCPRFSALKTTTAGGTQSGALVEYNEFTSVVDLAGANKVFRCNTVDATGATSGETAVLCLTGSACTGALIESNTIAAQSAGYGVLVIGSDGTVSRNQIEPGCIPLYMGAGYAFRNYLGDPTGSSSTWGSCSPGPGYKALQVANNAAPTWILENTILGPYQVGDGGFWSNLAGQQDRTFRENWFSGGPYAFVMTGSPEPAAIKVTGSRFETGTWATSPTNIATTGSECWIASDNRSDLGVDLSSDFPAQAQASGDCAGAITDEPTLVLSGLSILPLDSCSEGQTILCTGVDLSASVISSTASAGNYRWRYNCGGASTNTGADPCAAGRCTYQDGGADLWYPYAGCDGQASCVMANVCDFQAEPAGTYPVRIYVEAGPGASARMSAVSTWTFTVN